MAASVSFPIGADDTAPRSELRLRNRPHFDPRRRDEAIVEIVRDGQVVGTIYGSREGVHIISDCFGQDGRNVKVQFTLVDAACGLLIPMLRPGETCPWCHGSKVIGEGDESADCPVCQ
jgi:hypothetical protein